jgi:pantoate kinase
MASRSTAFCPGHVTAFFEILEDPDVLRKGSKGAGLCLSKGVTSTVEVSDSTNQDVSVCIDRLYVKNSVTELAMRKWLGSRNLNVSVDSLNQLPVSQGFGLSGAGALSALMAVADAAKSGQSIEELVRIAHISEVESFTGLGDVYPQSMGGLVIRELPGAPPYGQLKKIEIEQDIVLCILGGVLETRDILQNRRAVKKINRAGKERVESFISNPDLERLFILSEDFAKDAGLASEEILKAIDDCAEYGYAGMSMLGNSVFASGETEILEGILKRSGKVIRCEVDNRGARTI